MKAEHITFTTSILFPRTSILVRPLPTVGENIRAFFGSQSRLSNFHPSKFHVDGIEYDWNKQFYQKKKADFVGDDEAGARIIKAITPFDCLKVGY